MQQAVAGSECGERDPYGGPKPSITKKVQLFGANSFEKRPRSRLEIRVAARSLTCINISPQLASRSGTWGWRVGDQTPAISDRLNGWKAIAAYFGRDRTTVMRWARERNMPVRRIPGGKQGSIFALRHELALWAMHDEELASSVAAEADAQLEENELPHPVQSSVVETPNTKRLSYWTWPLACLIAIALAGFLLILSRELPEHGRTFKYARAEASALALPGNPVVARDYIAARDRWARRTPQDLKAAITLYEGVIRRDPTFAPAFAGLADAWLISREYGEVDEPTAYRHARRYAEQALRLDPRLPGAHRARGFVDHWWNGETPSALAHFRQALALNDTDAQTHFWYANVLADVGADAAAQREYDKARLLAPGSIVIEVEQACSQWQAGRDLLAITQLRALARRSPDDPTIYNCLAWAEISRGNIGGYAQMLSKRAHLRGERQLLQASAALDEAIRRDPHQAVHVLVAQGRREIATGARRLRDTPAFFSSAMGERAALVQLMTEAVDLHEQWFSRPVTRRIAARWRGDAEVERLLAALVPKPVPDLDPGRFSYSRPGYLNLPQREYSPPE